MVAERPLWGEQESEIKPPVEETKVIVTQASPKPGFRQSIKAMGQPLKVIGFKIFNALMTLVCFIAVGAGGWYSHQYMTAPNFAKAQGHLQRQGHAEDAARLGEMGRVCPDGAETPIACSLLYMEGRDDDTRISSAHSVINVPK